MGNGDGFRITGILARCQGVIALHQGVELLTRVGVTLVRQTPVIDVRGNPRLKRVKALVGIVAMAADASQPRQDLRPEYYQS